MEYVYAAMLIHKAGGKIDEATVKKVLEAAGVKTDESRVKALVAEGKAFMFPPSGLSDNILPVFLPIH